MSIDSENSGELSSPIGSPQPEIQDGVESFAAEALDALTTSNFSVAAEIPATAGTPVGASFEGQLDPPQLLPARMLHDFLYCSRSFYIEWVNQEWAHNPDTKQGEFVHRVVDRVTGAAPAEDSENPFREARSLQLSSEKLGFVGVVDLVESQEGEIIPVDYKKGKVPKGLAFQAWEADRAQLCVAGLLLQEAGYTCTRGSIYYAGSKRRVDVNFDDELVDATMSVLEELREIASLPQAPPPLIDSPKCPRCSLVGICLPDEVNLLSNATKEPPRRLMARDPSARPLYVTEQGARVGKSGGRLQVKKERDVLQAIRLIDVSQLCLFGNVQVSSQCIRELMSNDVPVCWFSYGGWFSGMATGLPSKHVELRRRQVGTSSSGRMEISRAIVRSKILNSRTILRRNAKVGSAGDVELESEAEVDDAHDLVDDMEASEFSAENDSSADIAVANDQRREVDRVLRSLQYLGKKALLASSTNELMGIEGSAARDYFSVFNTMLLGEHSLPGQPFSFEGRNRRPPLDPINCLLSYCYSLLTKDLTIVVHAVGFDPYIGFFHKPRFGRPALALDLAEEFRPLVADSVVLTLINNGEIRQSDFIVRSLGVTLTREGKKKVLAAYERRLDVEVMHPVFEYKISYRRLFGLQARLLGATLLEEVEEYTPFATR